ncbi:F-box protein family [Quillaja saponaria]|uniref:F-box protein family n=1 Tax=Quillaja saponaria TaxID=32244 RepID=A0AAD7Q4Z5_QUISA|nr:F-box protein family [Quillaja saponaria]
MWGRSLIDNYVHGACHWRGYDDVEDLILAFEMSDEMFREIRRPDFGISSDETTWDVASFKESLSVIAYPLKGIDKYFDLWVMEDYGNEESWTKEIRIGPILGIERPLGFCRNHQWMLEASNGRMILSDPDVDEIKNLVVRREGYSFQAAIYMESLVSLKGENEENQAACHWGGDDDVGDLILAFDMSDEMFRKIRGPALGISSDETRWSVASFKESLSVITYPRKGIDKYFDLWVMEDYGNEESWTKQIRIGPILGMQRPLGFWRNHQWILETTNGRMILYDPDVDEIKNLVVHREGYSFQAAIYMESLVSLKGENEENQAGISFLDIVPDSPLFDSSS